MHITVNDICLNGRSVPYEMLINATSASDQIWLNGLARVISALMARGDGTGIADILRQPHMPGSLSGRVGAEAAEYHVAQILSAICEVLDEHAARTAKSCEGGTAPGLPRREAADPAAPTCPECGTDARIRFEGCWVCHRCGAAACG